VYQLNEITEIDDNIFDSIYENNKTQIVVNNGYDDKEKLKFIFKNPTTYFKLFFEVTYNSEVVGYYQGKLLNNHAYLYNAITKTEQTFKDAVDVSTTYLKGLGCTHVVCSAIPDTNMYNYCLASCERTDIFAYEKTENTGDTVDIFMRLV